MLYDWLEFYGNKDILDNLYNCNICLTKLLITDDSMFHVLMKIVPKIIGIKMPEFPEHKNLENTEKYHYLEIILENCPNIKTLDLKNVGLNDSALLLLFEPNVMNNLTYLNLSSKSISNKLLESMGSNQNFVKSIKNLNFS